VAPRRFALLKFAHRSLAARKTAERAGLRGSRQLKGDERHWFWSLWKNVAGVRGASE
jgi:hypothetical protein